MSNKKKGNNPINFYLVDINNSDLLVCRTRVTITAFNHVKCFDKL